MSLYAARFDYHAPSSLAEALDLLTRLDDAKILAGGASLIPLMKLRLTEPAHLVDINRIAGFDLIEARDGELRIGALVREADLERSDWAAVLPVIGDACAVIADPLVRNVGTVGGNVAHGDPANDLPAVMLALGAAAHVAGPAGGRTIRMADFYLDVLRTALEGDEILTEIRIPLPAPGTGSSYVKFERQVGDFAIAAAAAVVHLDASGRVDQVAVAFTNLAPTAVRSPAIEAALAGRLPDVRAISEAAAEVCEIDPWDDLRATADVKRRMARAVAERALGLAVARARATAA
jgi:carbon-monoxide dehydrogenase medium subunit